MRKRKPTLTSVTRRLTKMRESNHPALQRATTREWMKIAAQGVAVVSANPSAMKLFVEMCDGTLSGLETNIRKGDRA